MTARVSVRRLAIVVAAGAAIAGCGAVLGFDEIAYTGDAGDTSDAIAAGDADTSAEASPADDATAAGDGGPQDATTEVDASSDGAPPGCVNFMLNPGFETKPSCDPWINYGGPSASDTRAHSGANACRACAGSGAVNLIANLIAQPYGPGDTLHFEAWVRAADTALFAVPLEMDVWTSVSDQSTKNYLLSDQFQKMSVDHVIAPDAGNSSMNIEMLVRQQSADADAGSNECILFDDVIACVIHDGG